MNCTDIQKMILLQDSGELTEQQRHMLANHLVVCNACRLDHASLASLRLALRETKASQSIPSETVLGSIREAAEQHLQNNQEAHSFPWRRMIAAAASVALCLAGLKFIAPHSAKPSPLASSSAATEIVPLVAMIMGTDTQPALVTGETELGVVTDQLLILQGIKGDTRDETMDEFSLPEDSLPTTLRWHNSPEPHVEKYG